MALVQDTLAVNGGAERVFLVLSELYPEAPIFTAIFRPATTLQGFRRRDVRPLWTNRLPVGSRNYRYAFMAIALAFERLTLKGYDLVISSSSTFAKSAGAEAGAHVAYCHTPPRFLWPCGASSEVTGKLERAAAAVSRPLLRPLDRRAAQRVTTLIANSRQTASRITDFYGRDSELLHPPLDSRIFRPMGTPREDIYLVVGRLVPYKRFDAAIRTCSRTGRKLVVIGAGRDEERLKAMAGPTVHFAGSVSEADLVSYYSRARAVLLPGEDDWGMVCQEANACGCPAIGLARGGNLETIVDGVNGLLYDEAPDALEQAIQRLESEGLDPAAIRAEADQYALPAFVGRMRSIIASSTSG